MPTFRFSYTDDEAAEREAAKFVSKVFHDGMATFEDENGNVINMFAFLVSAEHLTHEPEGYEEVHITGYDAHEFRQMIGTMSLMEIAARITAS